MSSPVDRVEFQIPTNAGQANPGAGGVALFATISGMGKSGTAATEDADGLVPGVL